MTQALGNFVLDLRSPHRHLNFPRVALRGGSIGTTWLAPVRRFVRAPLLIGQTLNPKLLHHVDQMGSSWWATALKQQMLQRGATIASSIDTIHAEVLSNAIEPTAFT